MNLYNMFINEIESRLIEKLIKLFIKYLQYHKYLSLTYFIYDFFLF